MAGICAKATAGVDVERSLPAAKADTAFSTPRHKQVVPNTTFSV